MRKLIRVRHWRCSEIEEGSTYMLAPGGKSEEEIRDDVNNARRELLLDLESFKLSSLAANYPRTFEQIANNCSADTTVEQIREWMQKEKEVYDQWNSLKSAASKSFGSYLEKKGYTPLWKLTSDLGLFYMEVSWGHRHGDTIDYSIEEEDFTPFPEDELNPPKTRSYKLVDK